ncbi:hypothetical protein C8R47DRAFT_1070214 [Mycena vitilis]|nr:hypothetical protein C8R47DRAFT_1070214 [Mycena vitilis]
MRRSRAEAAAANAKLDQLNFAHRGLGGDPSITTQRPVMRRIHQEQLTQDELTRQKMAKATRTQRATAEQKAQQAELRRAKARERMAIRRAKIKALPPEEQDEYRTRARASRAKWREENRRYLAISSWGYRHRKYVDLYEKFSGTDRTLYDRYLTTSTTRRLKKDRAQRIAERSQHPVPVDAGADEGSDLPDSSEIPTSDSE